MSAKASPELDAKVIGGARPSLGLWMQGKSAVCTATSTSGICDGMVVGMVLYIQVLYI